MNKVNAKIAVVRDRTCYEINKAIGHVEDVNASFSSVHIESIDDKELMVLPSPVLHNLIFDESLYNIISDAWSITQDIREGEEEATEDYMTIYDLPAVEVDLTKSDEETLVFTFQAFASETQYTIELLVCN
jgi:hypothetical protein